MSKPYSMRIAIDEHNCTGVHKCGVCVEANLKIAPKPHERSRELKPGQVIGNDVQAFPTTSHDGKRHMAVWSTMRLHSRWRRSWSGRAT